MLQPMKNMILIIGPGRTTEGGITSVIKEYENSDIWEKYNCRWIETYNNKNNALKIIYFVRGFFQFIVFLPFCKIVHIHFSWKLSLIRKIPFFVIAKFFGKKIIIHLHSGTEPIINSSVKRIYQYFFNKADITVLLANTIKNQLSKEFKFKRTEIVYNPCILKPKIRNNAKMDYILFAGHINESKGVFDLLLAFSQICKKFPSWKLIIAGNGNVQKLNELIKSLNIEGQTEFLGWVKGKDKEEAFKSCSVFCLPSYTEGFPMAVLDAWAYGIPVITTPVGGLPDVLVHGKNALVFEPGNIGELSKNLEELIRSEKLRNILGNASFQLSNNLFNMNLISKQLDELYQTI
jgi:glycosyltransferase involved in cell wall biosynthesis